MATDNAGEQRQQYGQQNVQSDVGEHGPQIAGRALSAMRIELF